MRPGGTGLRDSPAGNCDQRPLRGDAEPEPLRLLDALLSEPCASTSARHRVVVELFQGPDPEKFSVEPGAENVMAGSSKSPRAKA